MPNWCSTTIRIRHDDKNKLNNLYNLINEWKSKTAMANGFDTKYESWLGNIVLNSGVGTVDTGKETDLCCRGAIVDILFDGGEITIDTETAWRPMIKMWIKVRDKYLPDAEIEYNAEECGNTIYQTNDNDLVGRYIVDPWDIDSVEYEFDASEKYVIEILQELLDTNENDIDVLMSMFESSTYTEVLSIHKWEYINENELD